MQVKFDALLGRLRERDGAGELPLIEDVVTDDRIVNVEAGKRYIITYNLDNVTIILPFEPEDGDEVGIKICNGRLDNVVSRNGAEIEGIDEDLTLDAPNVSIVLRYIDNTLQWRVV